MVDGRGRARWLCAVTMALLTVGALPGSADAAPPVARSHSAAVLGDELPSDGDGDGITDDVDACPTEYGLPEYGGCPYVYVPVDTDGDGVNDDTDQCPVDAGSATYNGCPAPDQDGDGLADDIDACPTQPGPYDGCPLVDFDNDGVTDDIDQCPNQAGTPDRNGCPAPDSDNDGVTDDVDLCPDVAGTPDRSGCPVPDSDNDGVTDDVDQCASLAGSADNAGCPLVPVVTKRVTFRDRCGTRNDTVQIPSRTGISYVRGGQVLTRGRHVVHGSVTIDALAAPGFRLVGTTRWSKTFSERGCGFRRAPR